MSDGAYWNYSQEEIEYENKRMFCEWISDDLKSEKCHNCFCVGNKYYLPLRRIKVLGKLTKYKVCPNCKIKLKAWEQGAAETMCGMIENNNIQRQNRLHKRLRRVEEALKILE